MGIPQIFGTAVSARSLALTAQERWNVYYDFPKQGENDRADIAIFGRPGLRRFGYYGASPARAVRAVSPYLYALFGNTLYQIANNGTATPLGTISTSSGPAIIAHNGTQLMLVADDGTGEGYIYQIWGTSSATGQVPGDGLVLIASGDFSGADYVSYLSNFFLTRIPGTNPLASQTVQASGIGDGTGWDALAFDLADSDPDPLQAVVGYSGLVYLLGPRSTELWQHAGTTPFPFTRLPSVVHAYGCAARHSIVEFGTSLALLARNRNGQAVPALLQGQGFTEIGTPDLVAELNAYTSVEDARGAMVQVAAHKFFVLSFPTAGKTWAYDEQTKVWSRWKSNGGQFRGLLAELYEGQTIWTDYQDGTLYVFDPETFVDDAWPLQRLLRSRTIENGDREMVCNALQFEMGMGVGLSTGQGSAPEVMLRVSKDTGHTWGNTRRATIGKQGKYRTRAIFRRLGLARKFTFELSMTDPVPFVLVGEDIDLEAP
jgi:hypothetical protein